MDRSSIVPVAQITRHATLYPLSSILYLLLLLPTGCNLLGFAADKTVFAERDARYILSKEPMVVIAENWRNPSGTAIDAEQIEREVYENLRDHKIGPQIDPTAVIDLQSQRSDFATMSIAQIGKLVGAKQVVYVNLTETSLIAAEGSDVLNGKVTARVKVVDVETGQARWPTDAADGFPVSVSTPMAMARDEPHETALREKLLATAADKISRLFYKARDDDE